MKKGFALITVLALLIMIALTTATILQAVGSHTAMKAINLQEVKDQYITEAGMQYALYCLRTTASGCPTFSSVTSYNVLAGDGVTVLGTAYIQRAGTTLCVDTVAARVSCP